MDIKRHYLNEETDTLFVYDYNYPEKQSFCKT